MSDTRSPPECLEGSMPRLHAYDVELEREGDAPEHRVVGSSLLGSPERPGASRVEASGVPPRGLEVHSPAPSARFREAPPTPTPRPRKLSAVEDDASCVPTPRVSTLLNKRAFSGERHVAQWRGADEAVDTASGPTYQYTNTHTNLGMGTQWRPTQIQQETQELNLLMARTLERVTAQLEKLSNRGPPEEPEFEYSGKATEDPVAFFNQFEDWLEEHNIPMARNHRVLRRCLRGEAFDWFLTVQDQEWRFIRAQFLQRYDAPANKGALWKELFGRQQRENENVSKFIMDKWALFKRLTPETPEVERVQVILELLHPRMRTIVRGARCHTLSELLEHAALVEQDLKDEESSTRVPEPRRQMGAGYPERAPGVVREGRYQPVAPARMQPARPAIPPSPCRWCNGPHFNNECPTRNNTRPAPQPAPRAQQRQQQQQSTSQRQPDGRGPPEQRGNDPRAPATARDRHQ